MRESDIFLLKRMKFTTFNEKKDGRNEGTIKIMIFTFQRILYTFKIK